MGRYDDISDEKLRYEVQRFARILQRMENKGEVLERTGDILTLLGELRRMVFAWEVRCTFQNEDGSPGSEEETEGEPASETEGERIVREAREQDASFLSSIDSPPTEDEEPEADGSPEED